MEVITLRLDEIKPYANNTKEHPQEQIDEIRESIARYGMNDPIAVWGKSNIIVEGHGRFEALRQMGVKEAPCIRLDHLTDKQRREYTIAHNKTTMDSGFDKNMLSLELPSLDLGFLGYRKESEEEHRERQREDALNLRFRVENILNLGRAQFEGVGEYDIPQLDPVYELPKIDEWIGFDHLFDKKDISGKGVHFFVDDYKFERLWNNPDRYIDRLSQCAAVATPDFSPYSDMPFALQIYNHYRKHWIGAYLQMQGLTVIPTIRASADPRSFSWYLDGEPHGGIVLISSMWSSRKDIQPLFEREFNTMRETLKPCKILMYGKIPEGYENLSEKLPLSFER